MSNNDLIDIPQLAAGLTKAAQRAILAIDPVEWTEEGHPGPARRDAYSLWWGKDSKKGLVEPPKPFAFGVHGLSHKWKLSSLGVRIQKHLAKTKRHTPPD